MARPIDKGHRNRIRYLKYRHRLAVLGLKEGEWQAKKSDAKPCSCWLCRSEKYSRKQKHKSIRQPAYFV